MTRLEEIKAIGLKGLVSQMEDLEAAFKSNKSFRSRKKYLAYFLNLDGEGDIDELANYLEEIMISDEWDLFNIVYERLIDLKEYYDSTKLIGEFPQSKAQEVQSDLSEEAKYVGQVLYAATVKPKGCILLEPSADLLYQEISEESAVFMARCGDHHLFYSDPKNKFKGNNTKFEKRIDSFIQKYAEDVPVLILDKMKYNTAEIKPKREIERVKGYKQLVVKI